MLKCELDDAVVRKARQKRRAPPVAAVNQLAWSHDDLLVCACVWLSECTVNSLCNHCFGCQENCPYIGLSLLRGTTAVRTQ